MDGVPVANQRQDQQHHRDQQQPRSLRCIHRMPVVLVIVLRSVTHAHIVAPGGTSLSGTGLSDGS